MGKWDDRRKKSVSLKKNRITQFVAEIKQTKIREQFRDMWDYNKRTNVYVI